MSDSDTPPVGGAACPASCDALLSAADAFDAGLREANKAALFAVLAAAGITQVVVTFDGYGDSGQIESIDARIGDDAADLPGTTVSVVVAEWGQPEPIARDVPVAELIERLAYDYLGDTHSGWETNDGAYGEFVFDVAARTITLDHNDRYVAVEPYTHAF